MVNESNTITHLGGRKDGQSLVSIRIGYLMDNNNSKHIQNTTMNQIHIQIRYNIIIQSCGSIEGNNIITTNYIIPNKLEKIT